MVVIESVIKTNPMGRWYIELSDMMKEENEDRIICLDVNEYAQKIEMMGEEYGAEVEVTWSSEDDVSLAQINEVRQQIMAYEAEVEAKKNQDVQDAD
ncbi:MAG: hypothetical protein DRQ78_03770 [Epsilonproteobacteria bacterium]|nr:MAG: hypothetical protein DRQ78_03770 [Campylobacterota bacterium]